MVLYNQLEHAGYSPPPVCPQCGSHRTEVVGSAGSPPTIVIRCNACGARSVLRGDGDNGAGRRNDVAGAGDVAIELDVIQAVSSAPRAAA
jgi:hypothetical protein